MKIFPAMVLLVISSTIANADEMITSKDGRQFLLRSNGTYEEVATTSDTGEFRDLDLTDLKLDIKIMEGQKVRVRGKLMLAGPMAMLGDPNELFDSTPISLDIEKLPREQRKELLNRCANGCKLTVKGTVSEVLLQPGLRAESVSFK